MQETRVIGPPGTGKTTALAKYASRAAAEFGGEEVMVCSLTRAAAAEVAGRETPIPNHRIGTLHAFAYHALGEPTIADDPKMLKLFNEQVKAEGKSYFAITTTQGNADESAAENTWGGDTYGDRCFGAYQVARARLAPVEGLDELTRAFVETWERFKSDTGSLDFTDLLDWGWQHTEQAPGTPSVILADEAQDFSQLALRLLRKWAGRAEQLVTVGDPLQCLYSWAGTDADAFLAPDLPTDRKRTLAQSYRVPGAVHAAALRWIESLKARTETRFGKPIEYSPRRELLGSDPEGKPRWGDVVPGEVRSSSARFKLPEAAVDTAERYLAAGKSVMFIGACAYILEPLLAVLRKRGLPFHNPWRKKRGDWNPLAPRRNGVSSPERILAFLAPARSGALWTAEGLWRWVEVCEARGLLQHGAKARVEALAKAGLVGEALTGAVLVELFEVEPLYEALREASAGELRWLETHLLAGRRRTMEYPLNVARRQGPDALRETPRLIVGTAHSLKGSEADVAFVFPDLSAAAMREWCDTGEGRDGILRLFYVALTRPRETLVLCEPSSPLAVTF